MTGRTGGGTGQEWGDNGVGWISHDHFLSSKKTYWFEDCFISDIWWGFNSHDHGFIVFLNNVNDWSPWQWETWHKFHTRKWLGGTKNWLGGDRTSPCGDGRWQGWDGGRMGWGLMWVCIFRSFLAKLKCAKYVRLAPRPRSSWLVAKSTDARKELYWHWYFSSFWSFF